MEQIQLEDGSLREILVGLGLSDAELNQYVGLLPSLQVVFRAWSPSLERNKESCSECLSRIRSEGVDLSAIAKFLGGLIDQHFGADLRKQFLASLEASLQAGLSVDGLVRLLLDAYPDLANLVLSLLFLAPIVDDCSNDLLQVSGGMSPSRAFDRRSVVPSRPAQSYRHALSEIYEGQLTNAPAASSVRDRSSLPLPHATMMGDGTGDPVSERIEQLKREGRLGPDLNRELISHPKLIGKANQVIQNSQINLEPNRNLFERHPDFETAIRGIETAEQLVTFAKRFDKVVGDLDDFFVDLDSEVPREYRNLAFYWATTGPDRLQLERAAGVWGDMNDLKRKFQECKASHLEVFDFLQKCSDLGQAFNYTKSTTVGELIEEEWSSGKTPSDLYEMVDQAHNLWGEMVGLRTVLAPAEQWAAANPGWRKVLNDAGFTPEEAGSKVLGYTKSVYTDLPPGMQDSLRDVQFLLGRLNKWSPQGSLKRDAAEMAALLEGLNKVYTKGPAYLAAHKEEFQKIHDDLYGMYEFVGKLERGDFPGFLHAFEAVQDYGDRITGFLGNLEQTAKADAVDYLRDVESFMGGILPRIMAFFYGIWASFGWL